ncbi:MAG TPA: superinfection exclusion B family protein [Thermoanaerobaculia bacterium]|jgi:hypothetical protein
MDISKALDWIKLSPRALTGVALATGVFLFLGPKHLDYFGLTSLNAQMRPWIAVAFILSSALLLAHVAFELCTIAHKRWQRRVLRKYRQAQLHNLSPDEKAVLAAYIFGDTKTINLNPQSGVAGGLEDAKIISRSSAIGSRMSGFAYNIQPWARDYLREHPELLAIPKSVE